MKTTRIKTRSQVMATMQRKQCRRCGALLEPDDRHRGYCASSHRAAAARQRKALIDAGPGCERCYRGAVFFDWRDNGGRQRTPVATLESSRLAACWGAAGIRLKTLLEQEYKGWGFMLDFNLAGEREIAPREGLTARFDASEE